MNEKTVIAEKAPVKKAVAEKAPAKKPTAKKAWAKKPAAKKVQAKQPAVKTAPIRKVAPAKTAMKAFENSVFAMPLKVANKTFMASLGIFSYVQQELDKQYQEFDKRFTKYAKDGEK